MKLWQHIDYNIDSAEVQPQTKRVPFTVVVIGDKEALVKYRAEEKIKYEEYRVARDKRLELAKERARKYVAMEYEPRLTDIDMHEMNHRRARASYKVLNDFILKNYGASIKPCYEVDPPAPKTFITRLKDGFKAFWQTAFPE